MPQHETPNGPVIQSVAMRSSTSQWRMRRERTEGGYYEDQEGGERFVRHGLDERECVRGGGVWREGVRKGVEKVHQHLSCFFLFFWEIWESKNSISRMNAVHPLHGTSPPPFTPRPSVLAAGFLPRYASSRGSPHRAESPPFV